MNAAPLRAMDRLRGSKSARSIRRSHRSSVSSDTPDPEIARQHATTAASLAMLRSKCSYDALGGPGNMAVPPRRHRHTGSQPSTRKVPVDDESSRRSATVDSSTQDEDYASAALPPISEFQGFDSQDFFLPSSYRRLRKSRSMFSTGQRSSRTSHGMSSPLNHATNAEKEQPPRAARTYGTLRRSMSFLRGEKPPAVPLRHVQSHDTAIELARTQFQQQSADNSPQPEQSRLSVPKTRREHRPFRKTLRPTISAVGTAGTPSAQPTKSASSYGKSRSFSSSIKKGFKKVLGLSKPSIGNDENQGSHDKTGGNANEPDTSWSAYSPHTPGTSRPAAIVHTKQYPTAGIAESSESLATSRSRVTSWADSTTANTVVTGNIGGRSHLSVIDEKGHSDQNLAEDCPYGNSPIPDCSPLRPNSKVDSQRLYSALMRRIGESSALDRCENIAIGHVKEHRIIPTPAASVSVRQNGQAVRLIPSDESIPSPRSFITANAGTATPQQQSPPPTQCFQESPCANKYRTTTSLIPGNKGLSMVKKPVEVPARRLGTPDRQSPDAVSNSSSVYSRSTGGNPDTKDWEVGSKLPDEPGTATIYDTQRTTYGSPKRESGTQPTRASARPSADWKQWMHTEIAKIENLTPIQSHYREHAQIQSDENDLVCQDPTRLREDSHGRVFIDDDMWSNRKVTSTSNFSRPFSRSSSVRTVVTTQKEQLDGPVPPPPPPRPASPHNRPNLHGYGTFHSQIGSRAQSCAPPPMQSFSSNRFPMPESPTPRRDKAGGFSQKNASATYGRHPARCPPASRDARSLHSRSARGYHDNRRLTNENLKVESEYPDIKGSDAQSLNSRSPISSKRMVEMFLESRRRQPDADASDGGVGAFI
ncbi:uncharacterized protein BO97DRAFT_399063 [Aspergillus homomorphus CBS 101889]|uniref:Uncharacterized protein n=1 Tax=Aspergillus homomorphus (strain CBS 101889) TaxID=1450537 RepID=A0A395HJP6_ASPHC|nr:hypothetical protein BO97DRAFT_399063 [Aspergillus homomorphus CBS 101889]RAL07990.1 hypothetical protein BO97DRAFT_399063 [Aspergillus homomorphus CBS 101889]